jgi:hypothetical protein
MAYEALKLKKYWFKEDDLLEPINWKYVDSLPKRVRLGIVYGGQGFPWEGVGSGGAARHRV